LKISGGGINKKEALRKHLFLAEQLNGEVLRPIHPKKWLQIWVPKRKSHRTTIGTIPKGRSNIFARKRLSILATRHETNRIVKSTNHAKGFAR